MKPPPNQLVTTPLVPVNRSSVAMMLAPGAPGAPCVADHETMP